MRGGQALTPAAARILIVEDEPLIAYAIEETLIDAGFQIAGVTARLEKALAVIERGALDAAVLDANLAGVSAGPAALALAARGLPFVVVSGYSPEQQERVFAGAVRLQKPCPPEDLIEALRNILPG